MKTTPELLMPTASWLGKVKSAAIVLLVMLFSSATAWADDSGSCGKDLTWEFTESDSTLTIRGTGQMSDYGKTSIPWNAYSYKINKVILTEDLTRICYYAFCDAVNLKEITIPASVETIGENAFKNVGTELSNGCTLTVAKGSKLKAIGKYAFNKFKGDIDLHECTSLVTIGQYAFAGAVYLKEITIPASVERISANAFAKVGTELSSGCTLTFAQGSQLMNIGSDAFKDFAGNIDLHECTSLTTIDNKAFAHATLLKKITIPASVQKIVTIAFGNVGSGLDNGCTLTFAQGSQLKTIYSNAFSGFKGNIDLRECTNLTTIDKQAFENYKSGNIRLPFSLTEIAKDAFKGASTSIKVYAAYKNCVFYVNGKYRGANSGTEVKEVNIKSDLNIGKASSKKVDFYRVSFDDISMSFDTKDKTYVISNEQGLIDLGMKMCTEEVTKSCKNLKFKLAADLDFTNMPLDCEYKENTEKGNFMPIGKMMGGKFSYPFDGQGHTIKGLKYDGGMRIGLFYAIDKSGDVKNLTLIAPSFSGSGFIGGIAGENSGTITDCTVIVPSISGKSHLGGIAGYNNYGTVENCNVIKPSISDTGSYIGCIAGRNQGSKAIKKCLYDISTGLYINGYNSSAPASYSKDNGNKPVLHLNLGYGITSNDAITVSNYTMAQLDSRVRLDAYRAGYDLVDYKSEEVTVNDGLFKMPKKNVSVTAVWEPMTEIIIKGSLIEGLNWTTFYCGDAGYSIDLEENACAYTATVGDDVITLHLLGKVIPKGTAVIIVSEDNEINMIRDDVSAAEYSVNNDLRGVDMPTARTTITSNDANTLYMLSNKNNHFGFHSFAGTNVPARKAYFTIPSSANARSFSMVFENETTSARQLLITNHESSVSDSRIYDLNGRVVNGNNLKPGIYVKNGKKVVIK